MQLVLRTHHCFERAAAKYIAAWRKTGRGVVAAFVPGKQPHHPDPIYGI
jgi:hypothetical protein